MPQGDLFEALVVLGSGLGKSRAWHLARTRWQTAVVARLSATGDWAGTFVQEDRCGCLKSLHLCGWVDALTSAKR